MADIIASPSVRALAREKGIDIEKLAGELGRETVAREDLTGGGDQPCAAGGPSADTSYWDVDHSLHGPVENVATSRFAQFAAANLAAANVHIPQVTHHDRADMSAIESFRKSLRGEAQAREVKLTALAFHVKALARALRAFPRFNASLSADGKTLHLKGFVHIGVAVDTEHGLMVPVIRGADRKGLWQIAQEITDLATRAGARKIRPDEMGGASMSISNLGGIGGRAFTPIVNPPEVAILGITRSTLEPVWNGSEFVPTPLTPLDLSYDHRVINGAEAARFVGYFANLLKNPMRMII